MSQSSNPESTALLRQAIAAFESGQTAMASERFSAVLQQDPRDAVALYFLAVIAYQNSRSADALDLINQAIESRPDAADCHNLRGLILLAGGKLTQACVALRTALEHEPVFADAANNLGAALEAGGDFQAAEAAYRRALDSNPAFAQAASNLGRVLLNLGRPGEAEDAFRKARVSDKSLPDLSTNIAVAQHRQGRTSDAEDTLEDALKADEADTVILRLLGALRHSRGNLEGAEMALRSAVTIQPALVEAHDNLAGVLLDQGRIAVAEAAFKRALALNPNDSRVHSNYLLCQNYHETDPAKLFQAHREWDAQHPPLSERVQHADNDRLRIGYVSGDLRTHSVAYFLEPLLVHRDRNRYEITCYANLENPDATSERLRQASDNWHWISGLNDAQLADKIRGDNIDVLIDLSGHTAGNRLSVFRRRPAPVQVTWLGYPNTTGSTAIDYRITDAIADPPGAEAFASETLIRLEHGFLCYQPSPDAPPVTQPHATDRVAFGSFNTLRKITPEVVKVWAEILQRVAGSSLLLKSRALADPSTAHRIRQAFEAHGIAPERITLRGPVSAAAEHLALYADLDIALDPFPYNGTTTTCEALWMGVPVITLRGNRHAGRVGASILSQVGLEDYVASSRKEYIEIAASLSADVVARTSLRRDLRQRIATSTLCDAAGFCRRMESAFEDMWQTFRISRPPDGTDTP